ncbi:hypothetical protein AOLI_G00005100 [Acnodon oligacanthus]
MRFSYGCPSPQRSTAKVTHLLPHSSQLNRPVRPEDFEGVHSHTFKVKTFKKAKSCGVCKQAVTKEGLVCRVCKLSCHKKCEVKVSH